MNLQDTSMMRLVDEIAAEFDYSNDTIILQKYIYGLDRVLMEGPNSANVYYQQNSHGDTVVLSWLYPSFCVNTKKCKKRKCIFERSFIDLLIAF